MALVVRRDPISLWGQDVGPGASQGHMVLSDQTLQFSDTEGGGGSFTQSVAIDTTTGSLVGPSVGTITYGSGSGWITATIVQGVPSTVNITVTTGALAAGTYTGTVPIRDAQADNSPQDIAVTFTVNAAVQAPIIQPDKTGLFFSGTAGGSAAATQTITVTNIGGTPFAGLALGAISYTSGSGWLAASITGNTITVIATPTALTAAAYKATFTITDASATNSPVTISVDFNVTAAPVPIISLNPTNQSFAGVAGDPPTNPKTITVTNAGGGGSLAGLAIGNIVYGPGATGWLVGSLSGTTISGYAKPALVAAGNYTATFDVSATGAATVTVPVDFAVTSPPVPIMRLTPNNLSFTAIADGAVTAAQTVTIGNVGGGTLTGPTLGTPSEAWFVPSISGTDISAYCDPTGLSAGTVTATVSVDDASAASVTLSVTFIVTAAPSPVLNFSGTTANFTAVAGGASPTPQTITITNSAGAGSSLAGPAVGAKTYSPAGAWLTTAVTTVTAGQTYTLTLTPATGALTAGTYGVSFPVTDASASNSPVTITVSFVVTSVTPPGNFTAPRFALPTWATFNTATGEIEGSPFTKPDADPSSATYYYGATGTANPGVAQIRTVTSRAELLTQAALAVDGDIIEYTAFTISSRVVWPRRADHVAKPNGFVLVRPASGFSVPIGDRPTVAQFASVPKISCAIEFPITWAAGAKGFHFRGCYFDNTVTSSSVDSNGMLWFSYDPGGSTTQTSLTDMPTRLVMEQNYIRNNWTSGGTKYCRRSLRFDGQYGIIQRNLFLGNVSRTGDDTQAILMINGLGYCLIEDNALQAAGEVIMTGGGPVSMGSQSAYNSHCLVRENYIYKDTAWFTAGIAGIKNQLELKNGQNWTYVRNHLANHSGRDQQQDVVFKASPYTTAERAFITTRNINFINNYSTNGVGSFEVDGGDVNTTGNSFPNPGLGVSNIYIAHNAFMNRYTQSSATLKNKVGGLASANNPITNVIVDHNWFSDTNSCVTLTQQPSISLPGFEMTNNIFASNVQYQAVLGQNIGPNVVALNAYCGSTNYKFRKNACVHTAGASDIYGTGTNSLSNAPHSNICYTSTATLTSKTSTAATHRNVLPSATDLYQAGTDGKDIGPNWDLLQRAVAATS